MSKTLKEIDEMPADEVLLWQFYLSEPRGEIRADYHAAQICHAVYTVISSFGDSDIKLKLEDNLLKFTSGSEPMTEDSAKKQMELNKLVAGSAFCYKKVSDSNDKSKT